MRTKMGPMVILLASAAIFGAIVVNAQSRKDWRATEKTNETSEIKLVQKYTGVTPGSGNNLPRVDELRNKPGTWVTWPGFILLDDGTSRLFLQTTIPLKFGITEKKKSITLKLRDAKVHLWNNRNPLVTTHFNTPLNRAFLKARKNSLELIMELRQAVSPSINQTVDSDGYHYLFIDFPPGNYPMVAVTRQSFEGRGTPASEAQNEQYMDTDEQAEDKPSQ